MAPASVLTSRSLGFTRAVHEHDLVSLVHVSHRVRCTADRPLPGPGATRLHGPAPPSAAGAPEATAAVNRSHARVAAQCSELAAAVAETDIYAASELSEVRRLCRDIERDVQAVAEAQDWQWDISGGVVSD